MAAPDGAPVPRLPGLKLLEGKVEALNLIIKGDVDGSVQALAERERITFFTGSAFTARTITWACGLLAATKRITVFGTCQLAPISAGGCERNVALTSTSIFGIV